MNKKNIITTLLILCSIAFSPEYAISQSKSNPTWVSLYMGINDNASSPSRDLFQYDFSNHFSSGVELSHYLNPSFDFSASLFLNSYISAAYNVGTSLMGKGLNANTKSRVPRLGVNASLFMKYKLSNDYLLPSEFIFHPYVFFGVGASNKNERKINVSGIETVQFPIGTGVDIPLIQAIHLTYRTTYNRALRGNLNGAQKQSVIPPHIIGLKFSMR